MGRLAEVKNEFPRVLPRLDRFHWGNVRDRRNGCYLIDRNVFDLWTNRTVDSDAVPAILANEHFLKAIQLCGHDYCVNILRGQGSRFRSFFLSHGLTDNLFQKRLEVVYVVAAVAFISRKFEHFHSEIEFL